MQACRTRATLVVKRRDTRQNSASSLCEDLFRRSCARSLCKAICTMFHRRSPQKIFVKDLKIRSLFKLSMNDLHARPLLSSPRLCTRSPKKVSWQSLYKISMRTLLARSLNKICIRGPLARSRYKLPMERSLGKMSVQDSRFLDLCEPAQSTCTWTCHKSHFVWKFTGKMPDATATTSNEPRALTITVRTPLVWPHCLGKKRLESIAG